MTETGAQSLAIDSATDLATACQHTRAQGLGLIGNVRLPTVGESYEDGYAAAEQALALGQSVPGYVLGLGGPLPYAADERWLDGVGAALTDFRANGFAKGSIERATE